MSVLINFTLFIRYKLIFTEALKTKKDKGREKRNTANYTGSGLANPTSSSLSPLIRE